MDNPVSLGALQIVCRQAVIDAVRSRNPKTLDVMLQEHVIDGGRRHVAFLKDRRVTA